MNTYRMIHAPADFRFWRNTCALLASGLILAQSLANAGIPSANANPNPGVIPPHTRAYGKSYSEWAAVWWQWALGIPSAQNPLLDTTGEFAGIHQSGPVFFLGGNLGGVSERTVIVPAGKALFFPLMNAPWVQFPTDPPYTIDEIRAILAQSTDNATLTCELDGKPLRNLPNYREQSAVFGFNFPENNIFGIDPGFYQPCLDDGYYLMLAPLTLGTHTLHFTATSSDGLFHLDVSYILIVQ